MHLPPGGEDAFSINAFNLPQRDAEWLKKNLDNEEEVLRFLDDPNNNLEDQPTEVLIELAQKLKDRRTKHYEEMVREQQEQDRLAAEQEELNKKMVEQKENELKEDMRKAIEKAEAGPVEGENEDEYI